MAEEHGEALFDELEPDAELAWDDFDDMVQTRLRMALETAGPSAATEDRIWASLRASIAPDAENMLELSFPVAAEAGVVPAGTGELPPMGDTAAGFGLAVAYEAVEPEPAMSASETVEAIVAETTAAFMKELDAVSQVDDDVVELGGAEEDMPAVVQEPDAAAQPILELVPGEAQGAAETPDAQVEDVAATGATSQVEELDPEESHLHEADETTDLSDAQLNHPRRRFARIPARMRYLAAAACVVGFVSAIAISALRQGDMNPRLATPSADGSASEEAYSYDAGGEDGLSAEYAMEDSVAQDTVADRYPQVALGDELALTTVQGGPAEAVDPTAVGEFVGEAVATAAADESDTMPCEVYRLIARSDEDGAVYVVRYAGDDAFYLAFVV